MRDKEILRCLITSNKEGFEKVTKAIGDVKASVVTSNTSTPVSSKTPKHELIEGISKEFSDFSSITFTVIEGEASITVNGNVVKYPIIGSNASIVGTSYSSSDAISDTITVDATNGKVYITYL